MRDPMADAMRRAQRYWYVDGLVELGVGCLFLLLGVLLVGQGLAPRESPLVRFGAIGIPILVIGGASLVKQLVAAAKARLTYPRTGYVAYRRPGEWRRWVSAGIGGVVALLLVRLVTALPTVRAWMPVVPGVLGGLFLLYLAHRLELGRFYLLAAVSVLLGLVIPLASLDEELSIGAYFGLMGFAVTLSGGLTFLTYLHQTQAPDGKTS